MKKMLLMCAMLSFCFVLSAEEQCAVKPAATATDKKEAVKTEAAPAANQTAAIEKWDSVQFGFWFGFPPSTQRNNVCGIKIGAPFCDGPVKVSGVETALFCGATDNIEGLQACVLVSVSKKLEGLQFSIVNIGKVVKGLQLGVFNYASSESFQIGIINYMKGSAIPLLPIVNFKF
jgi:hypothetical protein